MSPAGLKTPIDKSETTTDAKIKSLKPSEEKPLDATYSVSNEEVEKEATVYEKVKGFLFGKSKNEKLSKAEIKTSGEIVTPVEISSEPDLKQVQQLSKDEVVKDVATDISTGRDVQEIAVRF